MSVILDECNLIIFSSELIIVNFDVTISDSFVSFTKWEEGMRVVIKN